MLDYTLSEHFGNGGERGKKTQCSAVYFGKERKGKMGETAERKGRERESERESTVRQAVTKQTVL